MGILPGQIAGAGIGWHRPTTPDPDGGEIERDHNGDATGILKETAIELVDRVIPEPTFAENLDAMRLAQAKLHSMGVTSIHLMGGDTLAGVANLARCRRIQAAYDLQHPG